MDPDGFGCDGCAVVISLHDAQSVQCNALAVVQGAHSLHAGVLTFCLIDGIGLCKWMCMAQTCMLSLRGLGWMDRV